jgi:hypothetical protein
MDLPWLPHERTQRMVDRSTRISQDCFELWACAMAPKFPTARCQARLAGSEPRQCCGIAASGSLCVSVHGPTKMLPEQVIMYPMVLPTCSIMILDIHEFACEVCFTPSLAESCIVELRSEAVRGLYTVSMSKTRRSESFRSESRYMFALQRQNLEGHSWCRVY